VSQPTIPIANTVEDVRINPIGLVVLQIAKIFPQEVVHRVYNSYFRGDASDYGVIADFLRGNVPFVKKLDSKDATLIAALSFVHDRFKPPRNYRPVHFADLRFYPWELSTSVEEPLVSDPTLVLLVKDAYRHYLTRNERMSKSQLYNAAFMINRTHVHNIKETPNSAKAKIAFFITTAHARSHLTKVTDEAKIRMVFGVPWLFLMVELMLLWPLMNWFRKGFTPIAWTYEIMNGGMHKINTMTQPNDLYICLDWKQFDKRAQYDLIDKIYDMWKGWMNFSGYMPTQSYPDRQVKYSDAKFKQRILRLWSWMSAYLKHMHIRLPDGSIWSKKFAGIASGMLQTQILDSFINLLMLITCLITLKVPLPEFSLVLGDDSLLIIRNFGTQDPPSLLTAIATIAFRLFGAIVNVDKSIITNDPNQIVFLAYQNRNGTPHRNVEELLAKFVHPERSWSSAKVKARALGFAYANCGVNERIHLVCKQTFDALSHVEIEESGSPFLRYYREFVDEYNPSVFPERQHLLDKLFIEKDRSKLDATFWPNWFFLDEY
jgi:hypothetical protein